MEFANEMNQGNREILDNHKWVVLPEDYINYLVGKEKKSIPTLEHLPNNIISIKKNHFNK